MGQLLKIITSWMIQWESKWKKLKHETSSRGGATMQTSPCRVFRIPISLIGHNPDKVHGGWLRNVNKANNVCRQKIIVPSDFGRSFSCNWLSHGWCLKRKRENDQNSHPTLSKIWQPQQGSWRTDTCREYVQQLLQTKYNCPLGCSSCISYDCQSAE